MKQLLSLFFFLLPCLAWAQYPSNGNQKITLGEQTTADGLIFRGVLADTGIITPSSDTSAYIILDTVNHRFYNYNRATNVWSVTTIGSISSGLTGVLPVANGGTGQTTLAANKVLVGNGTSGVLTPTNLHWDNTNNRLGIGVTNPIYDLDVNGNMQILGYANFIDSINIKSNNVLSQIQVINPFPSGYSVLRLNNTGLNGRFYDFGVGGNTSGLNGEFYIYDGFALATRFKINTAGQVTINNLAGAASRSVLADANGVLSAPVSSINTKQNVQTLNYGLNELLQINPVSFDYINKDKWGEERNLGFIVEDMFPIIPEVTGTMNNGDMYLDMTKLIPVLTKAIQEQQVLIKTLEQRIINLENK